MNMQLYSEGSLISYHGLGTPNEVFYSLKCIWGILSNQELKQFHIKMVDVNIYEFQNTDSNTDTDQLLSSWVFASSIKNE